MWHSASAAGSNTIPSGTISGRHVVNPWQLPTVTGPSHTPWMPPSTNHELHNILSTHAKQVNNGQASDPRALHVPVEWCVETDMSMYQPKKTSKYATRFEYVGLQSWLAENVIEPPVVTEETDAIKIAEAILKAGTRIPGEAVTTGGVPIFFPRVLSRYGEGKMEMVSWDQLLRDDAIWVDVDDACTGDI